MLSYEALLRDLGDEQSDLDGVVADLDATGWATPTPAAGWDVRDTIAHLAFSEDLAVLAMTDEGTFETRRGELIAVAETVGDVMVERGRAMTGVEVRDWWRGQRAQTRCLLAARDAKDRIPWIVGTMSAVSFATGRLMETWAHGEDIAEALAVERPPTARLRHIADLGVRTRDFSYRVRGMEPPGEDIAIELAAPDGTTWSWGTSATDAVRGPARDFCLVVTRRRHPDDTTLAFTGARAAQWMEIAQAFAGLPADQRPRRAEVG